jgi:aminoglycoside phosphotransferase (APT) family kinase protein
VAFPPARGERLPWEGLPTAVRSAIEQRLKAPVARADTQLGGFSPGVAARLELEDGRRFFAKAVGPEPNPDSPGLHRREAQIAAALPPKTPAPRLLFSVDDGAWVTLVFEDVAGHEPQLPWRDDELGRVLDALTDLAEALTPPPLEAPTAAEAYDELLHGWRTLATEGAPGIDPWAAERLDELAALEARWGDAAAGGTLVHGDVRADNILLTAERVVFVDWPHACVGAAWLDLVLFLPSIAMQGGPPPWEVFEAHPLGQDAPADAVRPVVAAVAGFFVQRSTLPPPPGLPTLREFQRGQAIEALAWLRRSLGES